MDYKNMPATISWSLDKFIKELEKHGVEIKLSVETPKDNEFHFVLLIRNNIADTDKLRSLARQYFGYSKKITS